MTGPAPDWDAEIGARLAQIPTLPIAQTYIRSWPSASRPVLVSCDDTNEYVLKSSNTGRQAVNDQIIAHIGRVVSAPVGQVGLVEVPSALILAEPGLSHFAAGPAHATRFVPNCSDRMGITHSDKPTNRGRFASLAILFGLIHGNDEQFIYDNAPPNLVYSVDHVTLPL